MSIRPGNNEIEVFVESIEENMKFLGENLHLLEDKNQDFANSLCEHYLSNERLSQKQLPYALKFWREAQDAKNIKDGKVVRFDGNRRVR